MQPAGRTHRMTSNTPTPPRLLTEPEAAEWLSISRRSLRDLRQAGQVSAVKMGKSVRYQPEELARFVRACSTPRSHGRG